MRSRHQHERRAFGSHTLEWIDELKGAILFAFEAQSKSFARSSADHITKSPHVAASVASQVRFYGA